jgi:hypothetical protein
MRKLAIAFSALAIGAAAVVMIPASARAEAKAPGQHMHHMKKHHWHGTHHYRHVWYGAPAQPYAGGYSSQSGWVCPGIGRSFECKVWPPPFEDDPDRKTSKY